MSTVISVSVYGRPPQTPEEIERDRVKLFKWIKAKIEAEKLNPEPDWDSVRHQELMQEIAISDLHFYQRQDLVNLLKSDNGE